MADAGSDQSVYPQIEVVIRDGQPIWQVSGAGITVHAQGGKRALELFWATCAAKGLQLPD